MQSSCSVLTIFFCISEELQSSARQHFHSSLTHLWLCPHTSRQFLLIFSVEFPSRGYFCPVYRKPVPLFWNLLWAVQTDTSSVSKHKMQSPEAVSLSESSALSHSESRVQGCLIPSALETFCSCFIIRVSNGPGWIGRGAFKFLLLLLRVGSRLEYGFW